MAMADSPDDIVTNLIPGDDDIEFQKTASQIRDKSTDTQAIVNMILTAVGVGLLALPRAVAQSGWIGAAVLIVVSVALAHFTVWMIWACMRTDPKNIISYQDIGERCYGTRGYYLVAVPLFLDLLAVRIIHVVISRCCRMKGVYSRVMMEEVHVFFFYPIQWFVALLLVDESCTY